MFGEADNKHEIVIPQGLILVYVIEIEDERKEVDVNISWS
jgi:hypothetical protein